MGALLWWLLTCLRPAVLRFAAALFVVSRTRAFEETTPAKAGSVLASLASLLGQGVFWQMDVLQTIVDQGHAD